MKRIHHLEEEEGQTGRVRLRYQAQMGEKGTEDCGSLFWPLSCHLNCYNANRARVTSGGIPALCIREEKKKQYTECLCPFYSPKTSYSTEPRITMQPWKSRTNRPPQHPYSTCFWWAAADRWSQLAQTNRTTDQCFCAAVFSLAFFRCLTSPAAKFAGRAWWQTRAFVNACVSTLTGSSSPQTGRLLLCHDRLNSTDRLQVL